MIQFSIITISLNAAETLKQTIQSINEQTYPWIEHIIVDGGSKDASIAVIHNTARRNVTWVSEPDGGIADAFNKGTAMATGHFLCYLNAGDVFVSENVLTQVAQSIGSDSSERPVVYFGDFVSIKYKTERLHRTSAAPRAFAWLNPINHQSAFIPRNVATDNPYDKRLVLAMDYDFWLRVLSKVSFEKLSFPIAKFALDGRSSDPAWAVHNLFVRRALWHINQDRRLEMGDILILLAKAVYLKAGLALRQLLGTTVSGSFRRLKATVGTPAIRASSEILVRPSD